MGGRHFIYEWWKDQILKGSTTMSEARAAEAVQARGALAEALVDDLVQMQDGCTEFEFLTSRFKVKARVIHAEQWIAADGAVSVVFKMETAGAPARRNPEAQEGWKP